MVVNRKAGFKMRNQDFSKFQNYDFFDSGVISDLYMGLADEKINARDP